MLKSPQMLFRTYFILFLILFSGQGIVSSLLAATPPHSLRSDIALRHLMNAETYTYALAKDPSTGALYSMRANGDIVYIHQDGDTAWGTHIYSSGDHGIESAAGFTFSSDGTLFILGNIQVAAEKTTFVRIQKGVLKGDETNERIWTTVAESEHYPYSGIFDHLFNCIIVSPDGKYLFVNSGARGNHGEIQDNGGAFPGTREVPLTSVVLRIPINAENLILHNDEAWLRNGGYFYADGFRNAYSLAFSPEGELFGTENSGDRDDNDELNWIRENHHYGFPWRMGTNDNPQQFPGYDPDNDYLVNKKTLSYTKGFFHDDPTYPSPPVGVVFTDPVMNIGPDADKFRDPVDGLIKDGSDLGIPVGTFTPHRSPLGLIFDTEKVFNDDFRGHGFCLSWMHADSTSPTLDNTFMDASEDLLHLELFKTQDNYQARVTRIIEGFHNPVSAVIIGKKIYILETGGDGGIWEISLPTTSAVPLADNSPLSVQSYPNPAHNWTALRFFLPTSAVVSLTLSNPLGQEYSPFSPARMEAGSHELPINVSTLSAGTYFYRLNAGESIQTGTLTVLP